MKHWTKEFSLKYMTAHSDEFYLEKLRHRFDMFDVKEVCKKHFKAFKNISNVCDVGGGVLGGALALFPYGNIRILVDLLAFEYEKIGKLPEGVIPFNDDFSKIQSGDLKFDVVFSWECLDHAITEKHFLDGQNELVRILKPGGLLFFYLPLRSAPKVAHTVIRTEEEIMESFKDLKLIDKKIELNWNRYEKGIYLTYEKNSMD